MKRLAIALLLLTALATGMLLARPGGASHSYSPTGDVTLSDYDSDANADVTTEFGLNAPDVNFEALVSFVPQQWGVAADADVPDGSPVGSFHGDATLSLSVSACRHALAMDFTLVDATTDINNDFADTGNIEEGTWNGFDDVGGLERAIVQYPGFLKTLYPGVTPRARYYGHHFLGGGFNVHTTLMLLVLEPGTSLPDLPSFSAAWGYPSVSVLNDPTVPLHPGALGDFCTPLASERTIFGLADGIPVRTNPPYGGTYTFHIWSRGLPDADGDGFENPFDTCPFDDNIDTNPRVSLGPDGDGIDGACDDLPDDVCYTGAPGSLYDCDADGYANLSDNCPQVANGPDEDKQEDSDDDGIGDACDPNPNTTDGTQPEVTIEVDVEITGPWPDSDGDGIPDFEDTCPSEDSTGFDADDDGCIDRIGDLDTFLDTLFGEGAIDSAMHNSLHSKIDAAAASATRDNVCTAVNQLDALKNQIEAQTGKKVSEDAAPVLLEFITNVQNYMLIATGVGNC